MNHVSWVYHNNTTTLEHSSVEPNQTSYKLAWLSAKVILPSEEIGDTEEYDMDDFLSTFQVKTTHDSVPTLQNIFQAWCAYKKHWFPSHHRIEFYVIDELGQDRILPLDEYNFSLVLRRGTLTIA